MLPFEEVLAARVPIKTSHAHPPLPISDKSGFAYGSGWWSGGGWAINLGMAYGWSMMSVDLESVGKVR